MSWNISLQYASLHYITINSAILQNSTLYYTTLHIALHSIPFHYVTLHCIALHCVNVYSYQICGVIKAGVDGIFNRIGKVGKLGNSIVYRVFPGFSDGYLVTCLAVAMWSCCSLTGGFEMASLSFSHDGSRARMFYFLSGSFYSG